MTAATFEEAMEEVLQQSRYDRLTGRVLDLRETIEDAIIRFLEFIVERLSFNLPDNPNINSDVMAVIFSVAGILALLFLTLYFIRRIRLGRSKTTHEMSDLMAEIAKRSLTAAEWLALSQQHFDKGAKREAVRYRYIASLVALDDKKTIRLHAAATNAQIAGQLAAAAPGLASAFDTTTDCFHRAWFGYKPLDENEYEAFAKAAEVLMA